MYHIYISPWFLPFAILPSLSPILREQFSKVLPSERTRDGLAWGFVTAVMSLFRSSCLVYSQVTPHQSGTLNFLSYFLLCFRPESSV